ncbi:hypothetical protein [Staphylococcus hyicus]|uniref:hypothetical protein n=1 Tax=Staphylococcus hyicus TaxID=1284 RepID=UPI0005800EA2|nr:hypothetical protein [Staphylococcus hyicus]RTX65214.1 hypothetical protein EKQ60_11825 [Staphylococcus hyicus]SQE47096.1 Uncharacterised protein [Staphylococcus hyicus]
MVNFIFFIVFIAVIITVMIVTEIYQYIVFRKSIVAHLKHHHKFDHMPFIIRIILNMHHYARTVTIHCFGLTIKHGQI